MIDPDERVGHTAARERLDSWKEIANHLGRTVRTVQRWEELGLPVYRHAHLAGSSVYAFPTELDRWWTMRRPAEGHDDSSVRTDSLDLPRVAVLPFIDRGVEAESAHLSDGLVDDLITTLASVEGIIVVSRTSVMQFRDQPSIPVDRVAMLLSATLLVEGSLHLSGDQLLLTVRLIDPFDSGRVLWGQRYEWPRGDLRQLHAQVASDIAQHAAAPGAE